MALADSLQMLRESCDKCAESSRSLWVQSWECLRVSQSAISESRKLLDLSDQTIERVKALTQGVAEVPPVREAPLDHPLEIVSGKDIEGELVILDHKHFINCRLTKCTLRYSGGQLILESTNFDSCVFQFDDEAAMTVRLLECFGMMQQADDTYTATIKARQQHPN